MKGQDLGGYRLIEELGSGGMGVVHLGVDGANNPVAVKVLHQHIAGDEIARKRLAREVRTLRRIKHPRIAEVLDAELDSDQPFIITEFVDGQTLSDDVRANGPFAEDELVHFGHALLDALNAVHSAGVIHRDLKPANVMIMDGEPMVIDFGIAQVADEVRVTATGLVMGTPGYLSPEIADGKASSEKTDWWGWAATMAYAATGRNPYGSGPLEAVLGRVAMSKHDLSRCPANFVPLLRACLDPKPERRPSGQMILDALVDIESGRQPQLGSSAATALSAGSGYGGTGSGRGGTGAADPAGAGPVRTANGTAVMPAVPAAGSQGNDVSAGDRGGFGFDTGAAGHGVLRGGAEPRNPQTTRAPQAPTERDAGNGGLAHRPTAAGQQGPGQQGFGQRGWAPQPGPAGAQGFAGPPGAFGAGPIPGPGLAPRQSGTPMPGLGMTSGSRSLNSGPSNAGPPNSNVGPLNPGLRPGQGIGSGVAPRRGDPGQGVQPGAGEAPRPTVRGGRWVVFALVLLLVVIMPLSPPVLFAAALLWSILARTASRLDRRARQYRFERGMSGGGRLHSLASAPLALLAALATSLLTFILPVIAGIAVLVLARLDIAGIVPGGYSEQWSVWSAAAAGALVLWVGPGAASLRYGSRLLVVGATRNNLGRFIALGAIVLLIVLGVMVIQSGADVTWWPVPYNPFDYLPESV